MLVTVVTITTSGSNSGSVRHHTLPTSLWSQASSHNIRHHHQQQRQRQRQAQHAAQIMLVTVLTITTSGSTSGSVRHHTLPT